MRMSPVLRTMCFGLIVVLAMFAAGCGAAATTATSQDAPPGTGTPASADAPGTGGDEPNIVYHAPTGAFSFSHPQSWTASTPTGETVRFTGRDEFISVTIAKTTLSTNDFAQKDHAALVSSSPGFNGHNPGPLHVKAGESTLVEYTWNAGPSPVTGKMVPSNAIRCYIAGPPGMLAVYTYSAPTQVYDPYGALDFVNTFQWR